MTLDCKVEYTGSESLFHNQIYWFKVQNLTILETFTSDEIIKNKINDQDTTISQELQKAIDATEEISNLGRRVPPFDNDARFKLHIRDQASQTPGISFEINGVNEKDSGVYLCALFNGNNNPVLTIEYHVNVLKNVDSVMMMGGPGMMNTSNTNNMNSLALVYHENKDGYFMCKSQGGYPAPHISVFIEDQRVSGYGLNNEWTNYTLGDGVGGLQVITPIRWINSTTFRVNKDMNNKKIRCQAEIRAGNKTFQNKTTEKTLTVYFRPTVDCDESEIKIPLGGANIPVKCNIKARDRKSVV